MKSIRMPVDAAGREEMAQSVTGGSLTQGIVRSRLGQRYQTEGRAGMAGRLSPPKHKPSATEQPIVERIVGLPAQLHRPAHRA